MSCHPFWERWPSGINKLSGLKVKYWTETNDTVDRFEIEFETNLMNEIDELKRIVDTSHILEPSECTSSTVSGPVLRLEMF